MKYEFKLFIAGQTKNSKKAIHNLKRLTREHIREQYDIKIIDILKNPESGYDERIIAIPTLIKIGPQPRRRVVGDLSDTENVILWLGLENYN